MSTWKPTGSDARACLALSIAWLATVVWLGVGGEFPVSDDWAYAHTVRVLVEEGRFERLEWTWVPMLTNAGVGWLFSQALGFSFATLRISSAFMGWLGMLGAFALCRQLGARVAWSALAAGLYAWNPLHLPLALTFMTDTTFGALVNGSLFFLARGLPSLDWRWLAGGALLAVAASLSRQPGMGLIAVAVLVALATRPSLVGWLGFLGAVLALFFLALAPERVRGTLELNWYVRAVLGEPRQAFWALARNTPTVLFTLGAIVLPLVLSHLRRAPRAAALAGAAGSAVALALVAKLGLGVPPGIDWWFDIGIGPGSHLEPGAFPALPRGVGLALAALAGAVAGIAAFAALAVLWRERRAPERAAFFTCGLFTLLYLAALVIRTPFFDRYVIAVLAPACALLVARVPAEAGSRGLALAAAAAVPLLLFSLGATHDWRERERARAALLDELLAEGVPAQRIDGGTPFNATHNYGPVRFPKQHGRPFMVDDEYRVSFRRDLPGYRLLRERELSPWMPPQSDAAARVFRRESAGAP